MSLKGTGAHSVKTRRLAHSNYKVIISECFVCRQIKLHSLKNPVTGSLWFQTPVTEKVLVCLRCGVPPPKQVVKYLQPLSRESRALLSRALGRRLQTRSGTSQLAWLRAPSRGVPGRAGGGRGAEPGARHPSAGEHSSESAGSRAPTAGGMRAGTLRESRDAIPKSSGSGFNSLSFDFPLPAAAAPAPKDFPTEALFSRPLTLSQVTAPTAPPWRLESGAGLALISESV